MADLNTGAEQQSSTGRNIVVAIAAILVIVALVSAFAWPGWAVRRSDSQQPSPDSAPAIEASSLPDNASELLRALPDSVGSYSRQDVTITQNWASANPIEEYTVIYSTGDEKADIKLVLGQWDSADDAGEQYSELSDALNGEAQARGNVKVDGATVGKYVVVAKSEAKSSDGGEVTDDSGAEALWQNSTVVFEASGTLASVNAFYEKFPM